MKKLSRVYRWIVISVLLQVLALAYLNFIYLPNRGNIRASSYNVAEDTIRSKSMKLPSGADGVRVSYNGLFCAYMEGGNLVIADIAGRKQIKTLAADGGSFSFYRWLPDRDMLIYSESSPGGKKGQVLVSTYDIGPGLERSYPKITGLAEGSEVTDIELSPLTNVVYAMVRTGQTRTKIYKYDIMDNLKFVMTADSKTTMFETNYSDYLIYQTGTGKIYSRNGKTGNTRSTSPKTGSVLLSVDSNDKVYAGGTDSDGMVTGIYSGTLDQQAKTWDKIELAAPAYPSDIAVTPEGKIFIEDRGTSHVRSSDGNTDIKYSGKLLEVLDDYVVALDGSRLELVAMTK